MNIQTKNERNKHIKEVRAKEIKTNKQTVRTEEITQYIKK